VPDDVYRRLAADLRAAGKVVVADLAGSRLDAVLEGGIDVLKVSDEELAADGLAESGLRLGTAAGAANVTRHGLGSADAELVQSLLPLVEVREVAS
jgi:1-phosphofructokinase